MSIKQQYLGKSNTASLHYVEVFQVLLILKPLYNPIFQIACLNLIMLALSAVARTACNNNVPLDKILHLELLQVQCNQTTQCGGTFYFTPKMVPCHLQFRKNCSNYS